jgi:hypothetical protein
MSKTPAAAQAALLQALAAFISARESLDIAAQMHLQIVCDADSIPSQKDLADTKLAEFERAEELALAALIGAYRDHLAANEVREVVLDGQRHVLAPQPQADRSAGGPLPAHPLAVSAEPAQPAVIRSSDVLEPATLKQRFSAFLNGCR